MPRFRLFFSNGYVGAVAEDEIDIPQDEWEKYSQKERERELDAALQTHIENHTDAWWEEIDE